jgi:outer membrane protein OmpA-like peptidoglycan-associated protein
MTMIRTALPLILVGSVLTGCAGVKKTDWPACAAIGGATGAAVGAIESSSYAGWGGLVAGATAGAYCYVHGQGEEQVAAVEPVTPAPTPTPAPAPLPRQETIVVRDLHFAFDSAEISPADRTQLDTVASRLRSEASTTRLTINGHTDSKGTDRYNQRLSERRAASVRNYLVQSGVPAASIVSVQGMGESQPVATNDTAEGRATNRRVEILVERQ